MLHKESSVPWSGMQRCRWIPVTLLNHQGGSSEHVVHRQTVGFRRPISLLYLQGECLETRLLYSPKDIGQVYIKEIDHALQILVT